MKPVVRDIRKVVHFDPKDEKDIRRIEKEDPHLGAILRKRQRNRPYGHDLLVLKCGHTVVRPRPSKTYLWVRIPCDPCTRREVEMEERFEAGRKQRRRELKQREHLTNLGDDAMAKKLAKKAAAAAKRSWNQSYRFKKALKLEPPAEGIRGIIYAAIKKVKSGTIDEVTAAAVKGGLGKKTKQDPRMMTQSLLRQLAEDGAVEIVRNDDAPAKAEKASPAPAKKVKKSKKTKKQLVLKKKAAAPVADDDDDEDEGDDL